MTSLRFDQSLTHICAVRVGRLCMAQTITRSRSAIDTSLASRPAGSVGADLDCCWGPTPPNGNLRFPHSKAEFPPQKALSLFPERSELFNATRLVRVPIPNSRHTRNANSLGKRSTGPGRKEKSTAAFFFLDAGNEPNVIYMATIPRQGHSRLPKAVRLVCSARSSQSRRSCPSFGRPFSASDCSTRSSQH